MTEESISEKNYQQTALKLAMESVASLRFVLSGVPITGAAEAGYGCQMLFPAKTNKPHDEF